MRLKTILNHVEKQPGFVYAGVRWGSVDCRALLIEVRARHRSRAHCSGCGRRCAGYDHQFERRWQFVPLWGIAVYLVYAPRRVNCPRCGVVVEAVPWADRQQQLCRSFAWFLARWAKRLSWKEAGQTFGVSWGVVLRAVEMAVEWGRAHVDLSGLYAIGIDEVACHKGQRYLTVVYEIGRETCRLLWVGRAREESTLHAFFDWLGEERTAKLRFAVTDMWQPYLNVIAKRAKRVIHFLDRYHVVAKMNEAIDQVRRGEAKAMRTAGEEPVLAKSRWVLLKRPTRLSAGQRERLADLLRLNLRTVRAYLLKEQFQFFWDYIRPGWAARFLDQWCRQAMRSRIEPMKKIARSLRVHRPLLLNWFRARHYVRTGATEGMNNRLKLITKTAYGYRSDRILEIALFHGLGRLPEPNFTHRF